MIIYRPHRGGFFDAMKEAKEFKSEADMFQYIVQMETQISALHDAPFSVDDLVVSGEPISDSRNGWQDTRYVCIKRYRSESYSTPQVIGFCATEYK